MIRTLYDCKNARYPRQPNEYVLCCKGHKLGQSPIHKSRVDKSDRLAFRACQFCKDFEDMNDKVMLTQKEEVNKNV